MIPWYWQALKGILILTVLIIAFSLLVWFFERFEAAARLMSTAVAITIGIVMLVVIAENLKKLFDSWWKGPPPAST